MVILNFVGGDYTIKTLPFISMHDASISNASKLLNQSSLQIKKGTWQPKLPNGSAQSRVKREKIPMPIERRQIKISHTHFCVNFPNFALVNYLLTQSVWG